MNTLAHSLTGYQFCFFLGLFRVSFVPVSMENNGADIFCCPLLLLLYFQKFNKAHKQIIALGLLNGLSIELIWLHVRHLNRKHNTVAMHIKTKTDEKKNVLWFN